MRQESHPHPLHLTHEVAAARDGTWILTLASARRARWKCLVADVQWHQIVMPETIKGVGYVAGKRIVSRLLLLFWSARSTSSTGFVVGWSMFAQVASRSPWGASRDQAHGTLRFTSGPNLRTYNPSVNSTMACSRLTLQTQDLDVPQPSFPENWGDSGGDTATRTGPGVYCVLQQTYARLPIDRPIFPHFCAAAMV